MATIDRIPGAQDRIAFRQLVDVHNLHTPRREETTPETEEITGPIRDELESIVAFQQPLQVISPASRAIKHRNPGAHPKRRTVQEMAFSLMKPEEPPEGFEEYIHGGLNGNWVPNPLSHTKDEMNHWRWGAEQERLQMLLDEIEAVRKQVAARTKTKSEPQRGSDHHLDEYWML